MRILASFEWSFIWDNRDQLWGGFKDTMKASAIGIAGSFSIGLVLGAIRAHRLPVLNQLAWAYVEVIRNTPILVQIFFIYYGLPQVPGEIFGTSIPGVGNDGIQLETFTVAWLSITIWGGAFNTENFRAGFEAVPKRLREAGYALGFGPLRTFLNVTLPIGGRIALPSSINTYISVLKNTSLMLVIGYPELTSVASNIQAVTFRTFEMFAVLAMAYLVIVWTLSALIRVLERRLALPEAL
jgi:His/Glu/Gln/Arg/opine family amino acid ABC transporter permease subunit